MSRANRLLDLLQALRRHHRPVSGHLLAQDLGMSLRTLYCDIETLKAQGAHTPLMFTPDGVEAIVRGAAMLHLCAADTRPR